jgi:Pregnancy-associated plasma protein-A
MQRKNFLYILIVLLLFHGQVNNVQAQERLACANPKPTGAARIVPPGYYQRDISGMRMIKLFIYVTKSTFQGAQYAQTEENILAHFEVMRQQFAPYGICFIISGIVWVASDELAHIEPGNPVDSAALSTVANTRPDCLTVFIHKGIQGGRIGTAWNIPNNFVSLLGDYVWGGYPALASHEIGHALGLLHTFEDYYGDELVLRSGGCSNCSTTGDLICDTQADKDIESYYFSNCAYIGNLKDACNNTYIMEPANVMSYNALTSCLGQYGFTAGQAARMHYTIDNTPVLQNVLLNTTSLTITTNQNYNSGSYRFNARNSISLNASSYIVSGTTWFQMSSAEITISPGATLSTSGGAGVVVLRANTMCQ